jgi:hypothetical protein
MVEVTTPAAGHSPEAVSCTAAGSIFAANFCLLLVPRLPLVPYLQPFSNPDAGRIPASGFSPEAVPSPAAGSLLSAGFSLAAVLNACRWLQTDSLMRSLGWLHACRQFLS